jgi:uncharacterized protein YhfF
LIDVRAAMTATLEEIRARYPGAETFKFGDDRALCTELLALVRAGKKIATCGALRDYQNEGEALPEVSRRDIALTWDGDPALVIETIGVTVQRFCDVDEAFALAEGEDDSLEDWRAGHKAYFERNGGFHPKMMLVCERFRLVEDFG